MRSIPIKSAAPLIVWIALKSSLKASVFPGSFSIKPRFISISSKYSFASEIKSSSISESSDVSEISSGVSEKASFRSFPFGLSMRLFMAMRTSSIVVSSDWVSSRSPIKRTILSLADISVSRITPVKVIVSLRSISSKFSSLWVSPAIRSIPIYSDAPLIV